MKRSSWIVIVLLAAGLAWLVYNRLVRYGSGAAQARQAMAVAVEAEKVRTGTVRDVGVFTGSLIPKSQFVVAPRVTGWVRRLLVHVGDKVTQDQLIALLDDEEFAQQVQQAQAELLVAQANADNSASDLQIAQREYERVKALREKQIASASELDEAAAALNAAQARLKVSQAQVAQRQAALKAAELRLSYTQVKAYWEGQDKVRVVGERFVDEGALIQANQPIVSILQNDPITAVVYVIERDYPKVRIGQEAIITTDAYPGRTFKGQIVRIAPLLRESSRQARVEIEVPNRQDLLRPGMFVKAELEFARKDDARLVWMAAITKRNEKEGVFVVDPNGQVARFVPIVKGITEGQMVEILEPAIEGQVVTIGNHLLEDGSRIMIAVTSNGAGR